MTIGETLKRARKKIGLDLDDVVRSTKIAKYFLIALENDDISSLPQGVYTRNFLRTYARFLKLDEDILTSEYHDQYSIKPQCVTQQEQTKLDNLHFVRRRNKRLGLLAIVIAVPFFLYLLYLQFQGPLDKFFSELFENKPSLSNTRNGVPDKPRVSAGSLQLSSPEATQGNEENQTIPSVEGDSYPPKSDGTASSEALGSEVSPLDNSASASEDALELTQADNPSPDSSESADGEPVSDINLPVNSVAGISFFPSGNPPQRLADAFFIAGKGEAVWVKVTIDEIEVTNRRLLPGQVRCYRYGNKNTVVIGDAFQVSVQDGSDYRDRAAENKVYVKMVDFGPGDFFAAMDTAIATAMTNLRDGEE